MNDSYNFFNDKRTSLQAKYYRSTAPLEQSPTNQPIRLRAKGARGLLLDRYENLHPNGYSDTQPRTEPTPIKVRLEALDNSALISSKNLETTSPRGYSKDLDLYKPNHI